MDAIAIPVARLQEAPLTIANSLTFRARPRRLAIFPETDAGVRVVDVTGNDDRSERCATPSVASWRRAIGGFHSRESFVEPLEGEGLFFVSIPLSRYRSRRISLFS